MMQDEFHKHMTEAGTMHARNMLRGGLCAMALLLLALSCTDLAGTGMAAERQVAPHELRKMFPGQFRALVRGFDVRFIASRDGRLKGIYGSLTDTGRWSVRGNRLCIMLKDWLDGKMKCSPVRRAARGEWYVASGIRFRRM